MPDLAELNLVINSAQAVAATGSLDKLTQSAQKTEAAAGRLAGGFKAHGTVLDGLRNGYQSMLTLLGLTVGGIGAVEMAMRALSEVAEIEKVEFQFTRLLKSVDAARLEMERLNEVAAGTSFKGEALAPFVQQLMRVGYSANEATGMMGPLMDMAAGKGTGVAGIQQITEALSQMKMRGEVSSRELVTLMHSGIDILHIMSEASGETTEMVKRDIERGLIGVDALVDATMKSMAQTYAGAAKEQAETLTGLWSQWKNATDEALESVGRSLVVALDLKNVTKQAIEWVDHLKEGKGVVGNLVDDLRKIAYYMELAGIYALSWLTINSVAMVTNMAASTYAMAKNMIVGSTAMKTTSGHFVAILAMASMIGDAIARWTPAGKWFESTVSDWQEGYYNVTGDKLSAQAVREARRNPQLYGPVEFKGVPEQLGKMVSQYTDKITGGMGKSDFSDLEKLAAAQEKLAKGQETLNNGTARGQELYRDTLASLEQQMKLLQMTSDEGEKAQLFWKLQEAGARGFADGLESASAEANKLNAQLHQLQEMRKLKAMADDIGEAFGRAFEDSIFEAKKFGDVLRALVKDIYKAVMEALVISKLKEQISTGVQSGVTSLFGGGGTSGAMVGSEGGSVGYGSTGFAAGTSTYATGTVIDTPTFFVKNNRRSVMGEAGPEAIMPLTRDASGKLGVAGGGGTTIHQVFNIQTPDADSFRRSRVQVMSNARKAMR